MIDSHTGMCFSASTPLVIFVATGAGLSLLEGLDESRISRPFQTTSSAQRIDLLYSTDKTLFQYYSDSKLYKYVHILHV